MVGGARKKIILVDDNITNLTIGKSALSGHYDVFTVPSGEKLFVILTKVAPALILLDVEMPGMNGYEVLRRLKENADTADIPVIFLTGVLDEESKQTGLALGAVDYITKPFTPQVLLGQIAQHLPESTGV